MENPAKIDLKKSSSRWRSMSVDTRGEARSNWLHITDTLITLSTFLLGFIGVFIQIGLNNSNGAWPNTFIFISFISLLFSLLLGISVLILSHMFMNEASDYYEVISSKSSEWIMKNDIYLVDKMPKEIMEESELPSSNFTIIQIMQLLTFIVGVVFIALYFIFLIT